MKTIKYILYTAILLLCGVSCDNAPQIIAATSVSFDKTELDIPIGRTIRLTAIILPENTTDKTIIWSSSDEAVAMVVGGVVSAKKIGEATITAICGDKYAKCNVNVIPIEVESVTLDKTTASLKTGQTITLKATVNPSDAPNKTVTWSSSNPSVATVENGVVKALKMGSATITAKAGDKTATCSISVEATPVTSITLDKTSASLRAGQSITLTAYVNPSDATDKTVTWSSSNPSVATVENGVVKAIKVGSATITAKAGEKMATCSVTVEVTPVTSLTLDKTSASLMAGQSITLTATVNPSDATDKTIAWTSSNPSVASVEKSWMADSGIVNALKVGNATITAKVGDKMATCEVTVEVTPVTSITLDKSSVSLKVGQTVTLKATVNPSNATDKTVVWTSSNSSVATVENGVVKALKGGVAYITAQAGNEIATCEVTILPCPSGSHEGTTEEDW